MPASRRSVVRFTIVALTAVGSGCATLDATGCGNTPVTEGPVEVRLVGPDTERTLFDRPDVTRVSELRDREGSTSFAVTLADGTAENVTERFRAAGVDEDVQSFEVAVLEGDREITRTGIERALAETVASDDWDGELEIVLENRTTAENVHEMFRCG